MKLEASASVVETQDGRYLCALLKLELGGYNATWDVDACGVAQRTHNVTFLRCNCSTPGTVVLLYAHGFPQVNLTFHFFFIYFLKIIFYIRCRSHLKTLIGHGFLRIPVRML